MKCFSVDVFTVLFCAFLIVLYICKSTLLMEIVSQFRKIFSSQPKIMSSHPLNRLANPLGPRPAAALSLQNPMRREVTVSNNPGM